MAAGLERDTLSNLDLFLILGVELTKSTTPSYWLGAPSVELGRRQPRLLKNCQACGAGRVSGTSALTAEAEAVRRVAERPQSSDSEEAMGPDVGGSADEDASVLLGRWKPRLARLPLVQLTLELVGILG